jgi:heat shock protein HslJ
MKKIGILMAVLTVVMILSFTGCNGSSSNALEDVKWMLESYGNRDNPLDVLEGTEVTATFNSEDDRVTGSAGCNTYFGGYELKDGLSIGMLANTEMWCGEPEGRMDQETEYLKILQTAKSYTIKGSRLTIDCGDNVLVYILETAD